MVFNQLNLAIDMPGMALQLKVHMGQLSTKKIF